MTFIKIHFFVMLISNLILASFRFTRTQQTVITTKGITVILPMLCHIYSSSLFYEGFSAGTLWPHCTISSLRVLPMRSCLEVSFKRLVESLLARITFNGTAQNSVLQIQMNFCYPNPNGATQEQKLFSQPYVYYHRTFSKNRYQRAAPWGHLK